MSESPSDFVTMDELTTRVSASVGEDVPPQSLSGPLRDLKQPRFGSILMDVERPAGEGRVHNLTTFNDPLVKAFIRAMNAVEIQGLLPSEEEVAAPPAPADDDHPD